MPICEYPKNRPWFEIMTSVDADLGQEAIPSPSYLLWTFRNYVFIQVSNSKGQKYNTNCKFNCVRFNKLHILNQVSER